MGKQHLSSRDLEQISAYLDGELSTREKANFEKRLWRDPALRNALDEMGRVRLMLRSLPKVRAPRNFTLPPAYARQQTARRFYPAFGFASALVTALLVFFLLADWVGLDQPAISRSAITPPSATAAAIAPQEAFALEAALETATDLPTEAPPAALKLAGSPTPEPSSSPTFSQTPFDFDTETPIVPTATPDVVILAVTEAPAVTATGRETTLDAQPTISPTPAATATDAPTFTLLPTDTTTIQPTATKTPTPTATTAPSQTPAPSETPVPEIAMLPAATESAPTAQPLPTPAQATHEALPQIGEHLLWRVVESSLVLLALALAAAAWWDYRQRVR
jgi:hypothetical protein